MLALLFAVYATPPELLIPDGGQVLRPVVNGNPVQSGDWPDAVGISYGRSVGCTGVLVAPDVVLTAGHCTGGIKRVVLNTHDYEDDPGEEIEVSEVHEYENSWKTYDIAVLVLEEASSVTPTPIALDCVADYDLVNGADVAIVGFGNIKENGNGSTSKKHEGYTYIQDADCDQDEIAGYESGCNWPVSPGGELGAGGNDVDSCYGDSGGPLYLMTEYGPYVAGLTSRSYDGVPWKTPCLYGGIYVRPDAVVDWIEQVSGRTMQRPVCNAVPVASAPDLVVMQGKKGHVTVSVHDPDSDVHSFNVSSEPAHGTVEIQDGGVVEYTPDEGYVGADSVRIRVSDLGEGRYPNQERGVTSVLIEVTVERVTSIPTLSPATGTAACGCENAPASGLFWLLPAVFGFRRRRS
jgi:hypothetical protein